MNKKIIRISIITFFIIILTISMFFIVKYLVNRNNINYVYNEYSYDYPQDRLDNTNIEKNNGLMLKINNEHVVGIIKIDKINFEGLVYEGTSTSTLNKGVGHFENSAFFDGNVCLAAHNSNQYWAKLNTLQNEDIIYYTSFLGTRKYKVNNISKISETDWSFIENNDKNSISLITCVKGIPSQRLLVQGIEFN